ncbi:MAG: hypothetical protein JWM29_951, partial [Solirubrobacterales bacterium]|nr:hypothetical protein [Solirubrobacterales bacterium]
MALRSRDGIRRAEPRGCWHAPTELDPSEATVDSLGDP